MRPIAKDVINTGIEPGRTLMAGSIMMNLMVQLAKRYDSKYDILPSIDISLPDQDFTCDLGIFPPREIDWFNDIIRVEPPIAAFEIVMPSETTESLINAIKKHYFKNGVKSAWVISPDQKSVTLIKPDGEIQVSKKGSILDSATNIELSVTEIFA